MLTHSRATTEQDCAMGLAIQMFSMTHKLLASELYFFIAAHKGLAPYRVKERFEIYEA